MFNNIFFLYFKLSQIYNNRISQIITKKVSLHPRTLKKRIFFFLVTYTGEYRKPLHYIILQFTIFTLFL